MLLADMKEHYETLIEDMHRDAAQQEASFLNIIQELRDELNSAADEADVLRLQLEERVAQAEELQLKCDQVEARLASSEGIVVPDPNSEQIVSQLRLQLAALQEDVDTKSAELAAVSKRCDDSDRRYHLRVEELTNALTVANRLHEQQLVEHSRLTAMNVTLTQQLHALRQQLETTGATLRERDTALATRLESSRTLSQDVELLTSKCAEWERRLVQRDVRGHLDELFAQELLQSVCFTIFEQLIKEEDQAFAVLEDWRSTERDALEHKRLQAIYWDGCLEECCTVVENCLAIPQALKRVLVKVTLPVIARLLVDRHQEPSESLVKAWETSVCDPLQRLWKDQCSTSYVEQSIEGLLARLLARR